MSDDLITKYRPRSFDDVVGQEAVVKSLAKVLDKGISHSFIFAGPSGTGKTTLARIVARVVGAKREGIVEVDAATRTGVDDMRDIMGNLHLTALGQSPVRFIIMDEAQMLSKNAWNSMLKAIEEPPAHVYWALCTTEPSKIPATIIPRCSMYNLKPVDAEKIEPILVQVNDAEKLGTSPDVLGLIAEKCGGSPRQALAYLSICGGLTSRKEAAKLMETSVDNAEVIDLCRALAKGDLNWERAMALVKPIKDQSSEGHRMVIINYFSAMAMNATGQRALAACAVMDAFKTPYPNNAGVYPLLLSLGELLLQGS